MNDNCLKYKQEITLPELYERYSKDIYKYSFSILKRSEDAEDAVQEVFMKYVENIDDYKGNCSIKTWLLVITRNYCFNRLKSKNYNTGRLDDEVDLKPQNYNYDLKISLDDALLKLSPVSNELLYLKEYEGYSYKEIAEITELSVENVKIKLFRARQFLRNILKDEN